MVASLPASGTSWDRLLFSAKEAAFKACSAIVSPDVHLECVRVELRANGRFTATISSLSDSGPVDLAGAWCSSGSIIFTVVGVPS